MNKSIKSIGLLCIVLLMVLSGCAPAPATTVGNGKIWVQPNPDYHVADKATSGSMYLASPRKVFPEALPTDTTGWIETAVAVIPASNVGLRDNGTLVQAGTHNDIAQSEILSIIPSGTIWWSTLSETAIKDPAACNRWVCETTFKGPSLDYIGVSIDMDIAFTFDFNTPGDTSKERAVDNNFYRDYPSLVDLQNLVKHAIGNAARDKTLPGKFTFDDQYLNKVQPNGKTVRELMNATALAEVNANIKTLGAPISVVLLNVRSIEPSDPAILSAKNQLGLRLASQQLESGYYAQRADDVVAVLNKLSGQDPAVKIEALQIIFNMSAADATTTVVTGNVPTPTAVPTPAATKAP